MAHECGLYKCEYSELCEFCFRAYCLSVARCVALDSDTGRVSVQHFVIGVFSPLLCLQCAWIILCRRPRSFYICFPPISIYFLVLADISTVFLRV